MKIESKKKSVSLTMAGVDSGIVEQDSTEET